MKQIKRSCLVSKESISLSDSMILVQTEQKLIAELYEEADFPRDFRTRIVHRESGLNDSLLVEVFMDIIDESNPRIDYDPDWFKSKALPRAPEIPESFLKRMGVSPKLNIPNVWVDEVRGQLSKTTTMNTLMKELYAPKIEAQKG
jgi:hypothetical protein